MKNLLRSLALLAGFTAWALGHGGVADGRLDFYWIDVEGGGATLIVTPAGESVLIDSGSPRGRDAPRSHQVATAVAELKKIDHYVTTHFHLDHFGGAAELAEKCAGNYIHLAVEPDGRSYTISIPASGHARTFATRAPAQ
jgi:glyoxylase-like metal-dependent hydrolase (beta-lactamase superfamily II)